MEEQAGKPIKPVQARTCDGLTTPTPGLALRSETMGSKYEDFNKFTHVNVGLVSY